MDKEIIEYPKRFVCLQLKGSDAYTVIDVCDFIRRLNDTHAKTKLEYADALLKSAKYFKNIEEATSYMDTILSKDFKPEYVGAAYLSCEEGKEYSFLIHAINNITDNYSVHEFESVVFSAEIDNDGKLIFPVFLHLEKVASILNVEKQEANKDFKNLDTNKLLACNLNNINKNMFTKEEKPDLSPKRYTEQDQEQDYER